MSLQLFIPTAILPGDIIHSYSDGKYGRAIRRAIGSKGSHDALAVHDLAGQLFIGEAVVGGGRLTHPKEYEAKMRAGSVRVCVLRIPGATDLDRQSASDWFLNHIPGAPYDFWAYPRLLAKAYLGDIFKGQAGKEWAWYCTEAVRAAWTRPGMSADFDVWQKANPTPRTTEKRESAGALLDVSGQCLTDEGLQFRLELR